MKHCGAYDSSTNYEKLNVVTYQGSSYCAKGNTVGNLPTNTAYWDLLAQKGDTGEQGEPGEQGEQGIPGVPGVPGGAPLVASSISEMSDTTKVYVNTTDGKWYYYDGDSWEIGGTYQAAEDSDTLSEVKNFKDITVLNGYYPTTETDTSSFSNIDVGHYYDSNGPQSSGNMTSYIFTAKQDFYCYFSKHTLAYTAIMIYPSGAYPDANAVRYRNVAGGEQSLPTTESNKIMISNGSLVIITINNNSANNPHFTLMSDGLITGYYLNPAVIKNDFACVLNSGNLNIKGLGIEMNFNNKTFDNQAGLFELQDLSYNGYEIFGTENDYIGPVRVHGESIIGAKHGSETTTSYKLLLDGVEISADGTYTANRIDIVVNSAIDTRFTRISNYSIDRNSMIANSLITTLANLNIDYVFGSGIISCNNDSIIKWLNKTELSSDVLIGLNEITNIITKGGNLVSRRLYNNSGYGDSRVSFLNYTGRKKLYYYNTYGSDISIPSGTTFASGCEFLFK